MTINKNFKRAALSVAVSALFTATAVTAAPAQSMDKMQRLQQRHKNYHHKARLVHSSSSSTKMRVRK